MATQLVAEAVIKAVDQFSGPVEKMGGALEQLTKKAQSTGTKAKETLGKVGPGVAAGSTALAFPIVEAIKSYADFEEKLKGAENKFADISAAQFDELEESVRRLSAILPVAKNDLVALLSEAGASGVGKGEGGVWDVAAVEKWMKLVAEFSVAFDQPLNKAAKSAAALQSALNLDLDGLRELFDKMNALAANKGAKEGQLLEFERQLGSLSQLVGGKQAVDGLLALGSAMIKGGAQATRAARGTREFIRDLAEGDAAGKKFKGALEQIGLSAGDTAKRLQTDLSGTLTDIFERIGQLSNEDRIAVLGDLTGQFSNDFATVVGNVEKYVQQVELLKNADKVNGGVTREFETQASAFNKQIVLLNNNMTNLAHVVGKELLPGANQFVKTLSGWVKAFSEMNPVLKSIVKWGSIMALAFSAAAPALFTMYLGFKAIAGIMGLLSVASLPWVGGIVLAGTAVALLVTYWDEVAAAATRAYEAMTPNVNDWNPFTDDKGDLRSFEDLDRRFMPKWYNDLIYGKKENFDGGDKTGSAREGTDRLKKLLEKKGHSFDDANDAVAEFAEAVRKAAKPIENPGGVPGFAAPGARGGPSVPSVGGAVYGPPEAPADNPIVKAMEDLRRRQIGLDFRYDEILAHQRNFDALAKQIDALSAEKQSSDEYFEKNEALQRLNSLLTQLTADWQKDFNDLDKDKMAVSEQRLDIDVKGEAEVAVQSEVIVKFEGGIPVVQQTTGGSGTARAPLNTGKSMPDTGGAP